MEVEVITIWSLTIFKQAPFDIFEVTVMILPRLLKTFIREMKDFCLGVQNIMTENKATKSDQNKEVF